MATIKWYWHRAEVVERYDLEMSHDKRHWVSFGYYESEEDAKRVAAEYKDFADTAVFRIRNKTHVTAPCWKSYPQEE